MPSQSTRKIEITLPSDCFRKVTLEVRPPWGMTPERFREIVKAKGGKMGVACWGSGWDKALGGWYSGPVLSGTWTESGIQVYMVGVVDTKVENREAVSHATC